MMYGMIHVWYGIMVWCTYVWYDSCMVHGSYGMSIMYGNGMVSWYGTHVWCMYGTWYDVWYMYGYE